MAKPLIAITPGEPAGIGIDLCVSLSLAQIEATLVFVCDPQLAEQRAHQLACPIDIEVLDERLSQLENPDPAKFYVLPVKLEHPTHAGQLDPRNSHYVLRTLDRAIDAGLSQQVDALVTGPVHKGVINQAGITFTGHTEYLEQTTHAKAIMMLQTPGLRVALATTHLPLVQVSQAINQAMLTECLTIVDHSMKQDFNIPEPQIGVCGLNPHAGENGYLGREEIEIIQPVCDALRAQGMNVSNPLPADTLFVEQHRQPYDVLLSMYHDQGLPVLKALGFGQAVNVSLGLPIIRTSVDHGTALTLAGLGHADHQSLQYAIDTALSIANNRRQLKRQHNAKQA